MSEETQEQTQEEQDAEETRAKSAEADKEAEEEVKALEDDPPADIEDWPDGAAKYKTFGGPDSETGYEDGPTAKLGSADVRHHEDGSVSVGGEVVDNPEDYKGEPIPGGPTDPNATRIAGEKGVEPVDEDVEAEREGGSEDDD